MGGPLYRATWARLFAAIYERAVRAGEDAGLRERRRELLAGAGGRTLELGAGTGLNLPHYTADVTELVLTEPGPHMARQLRHHVGRARCPAQVVEAGAERLPFPDDHFDTVVATLVLCTIPNPDAALAEAARVLRPGGRLLFMEHVRAQDPKLARWQDRLAGPWRFFADGCNCNRDTLSTLRASSLEVGDVERDSIHKAAPIVQPLIIGSAATRQGG